MDFISRIEYFLIQQMNSSEVRGKHLLLPPEADIPYSMSDPHQFWLHLERLLADLHNYCQKHYLPSHYNNQDFLAVKDQIYRLPGYLNKVQNALVVTLALPKGYPYPKDLEYAIRRVNESDIHTSGGEKLVLTLEHVLQ